MNRVAHESRSEVEQGLNSTIVECKRAANKRDHLVRTVRREPSSRVSNLERWLLRRVLQRLGNPPLRIKLWNGESIETGSASPSATLCIRDRRMLWKLLGDPRFQFGEGYVDGRLEVEGTLIDLLLAVDRSLLKSGNIDFGVKGFSRWLHK